MTNPAGYGSVKTLNMACKSIVGKAQHCRIDYSCSPILQHISCLYKGFLHTSQHQVEMMKPVKMNSLHADLQVPFFTGEESKVQLQVALCKNFLS